MQDGQQDVLEERLAVGATAEQDEAHLGVVVTGDAVAKPHLQILHNLGRVEPVGVEDFADELGEGRVARGVDGRVVLQLEATADAVVVLALDERAVAQVDEAVLDRQMVLALVQLPLEGWVLDVGVRDEFLDPRVLGLGLLGGSGRSRLSTLLNYLLCWRLSI